MNCCDYDCDQGLNCPVRNETTRSYPRTLAEAFPDSPEAHFATYEAEISDFAWTVLGYVLAFFTGFFAAVLMM